MNTSGMFPLLLLLGTTACDQGIQTLEFEILRSLPHDPSAYTQGLLFHDGLLLESTGRHGTSTVRKTDPATGEVLQVTYLDEEYFGEGLARVGDELFQLTWQSGMGFVYDLDSLSVRRTFQYEGEGWGLCFDGESLFMSDGSDRISRRDPASFSVLDEIHVTEDGYPLWQLNELECVGTDIYANVYQTTRIVRIEKATGRVTAEIDGFRLSAAARRTPDPDAVLNGIAFNPETGTFFVTGKLWETMFEIRVVGSDRPGSG